MKRLSRIWTTIRGYVLWTYERGSLHYDVMVTVILAFIFLTPRFVNFKDKPIEPHPSGTVIVSPDDHGGFIYQVDASVIRSTDDAGIRDALQRIIEPIAGEIEIVRYEPQRDNRGHVTAFKVWVQR